MLDADVCHLINDPLAFDDAELSFSADFKENGQLKRMAISPDLGTSPIDKEIAQIFANAYFNLTKLGEEVTDAI